MILQNENVTDTPEMERGFSANERPSSLDQSESAASSFDAQADEETSIASTTPSEDTSGSEASAASSSSSNTPTDEEMSNAPSTASETVPIDSEASTDYVMASGKSELTDPQVGTNNERAFIREGSATHTLVLAATLPQQLNSQPEGHLDQASSNKVKVRIPIRRRCLSRRSSQ